MIRRFLASTLVAIGLASLASAQGPDADFSASPLTGATPLAVNFTDLSSGNPVQWSWSFGDGGQSSLQNPMHTYTTPGTYTVILRVENALAITSSETKVDFISVDPPAPVADFSGTPTSGVAPVSVSFTDLSSGPVSSWAWDFGDGATSTLQDPSHDYTTPGVYTVALTATGPGGSGVETKVGYITIGDPPPVADFSANPPAGQAPLAVNFSDLSTGNVTAWSWTFGDGGTSSLQNPGHIYTLPGSYTVSLTATGPGGSDVNTMPDLVVVEADLLDPSFELQVPGSPPSPPWNVFNGTAHLIRPFGLANDGAMPFNGSQWCELSATGTNNATPPSNPGGVTLPAVGGAGISQVFTYPPDNPNLLFQAAFLRAEAANSAARNDWMSVDVTDGVTTVNAYYRDTFSVFPTTSAIHGFPSTSAEYAGLNLETSFPGSTPNTPFTITIQVGNGGNGTGSSLGYIDHFRFLPAAETLAYGCGTNPVGSFQVLAGEPVIGTTMVFGVDNPTGTQNAGSVPLVAISIDTWPTFPCGITVPTLGMNGAGELLIQTGPLLLRPLIIGTVWSGPGNPAPVAFNIPVVPSIVGFFLYAQGLMFDPSASATTGVRVGLADAVRMRMGF